MDNEIINDEQQEAVVEKVSVSDLDKERAMLDLEEDNVVNNLIKSVLALNEEETKKAVAYVNKKIEILEKINNKK